MERLVGFARQRKAGRFSPAWKYSAGTDQGYGYDEIISVELGSDSAWQTLVTAYPSLAEVDLVRFTIDVESAMDQIVAPVDSVFDTSAAAVRT